MISVNTLNALCELVGALLAWRSVIELQRAPARGVYWGQQAFSCLWAGECLPYYLAHGDTRSAVLASFRALGLGVWTYLVLTDRRTNIACTPSDEDARRILEASKTGEVFEMRGKKYVVEELELRRFGE